MLNPHF
jgi:hypothetical protein